MTNGRTDNVSYDVRLDFRSNFEVSPDRGTIRGRDRADLRITPKRPIGQMWIKPGRPVRTLPRNAG